MVRLKNTSERISFVVCSLYGILSVLCGPGSDTPAFGISAEDSLNAQSEYGRPLLWLQVQVPDVLLAKQGYAGDIRIGDLNGDSQIEFVLFRSSDDGMKPCFIGAFNKEGRLLWKDGEDGRQPTRPGPVTVYDFDGDGRAEVLCFFIDRRVPADVNSMGNVVIQIRDGLSGRVIRQAAPAALRECYGGGSQDSNWLHQRLFIANFRGGERGRDFVVKLGAQMLAFDEDLELLWKYRIKWNAYGRCSAYIPAVGDIDSDNKDEVNGGYYILDDDGQPLWEGQIAQNMDSVAIAEWDNGNVRAICSGFGHVLDAEGKVILRLGEKVVPHGQEARVADFDKKRAGPEMIIRHRGHNPDVIVVGNNGSVIKRFVLNDSPNHTGMETVWWNGRDAEALLYNGGVLWKADGTQLGVLSGLPTPRGPAKMGWYHCIAANVCSDEREEVVIYNPWDRYVWVYTPSPIREGVFAGYEAGPRQYNARLMD